MGADSFSSYISEQEADDGGRWVRFYSETKMKVKRECGREATVRMMLKTITDIKVHKMFLNPL